MELTHSQISEILSNYTSSSEGFVTLQSLIMNSLMFHERELFVSGNAHEQCNGFRPRRWYSHGFEFSLRIPRSRSGNFYPVLLGLIRNESQERARLFNLLYTKGLTTEQIGEISRRLTIPFWGYWRTAAGRCSPLSITPPRVPCAGKTSLRH